LILSSNPEGELIFQQANTAAAVLALEDGKYPVIGARASYNGTIRYSTMTGFLDGWEEGKGQSASVSDDTIESTRLSNVQMQDIAPGDLQAAVTARLGRSIATATTIGVDITGIRDREGNLLEDNTKVTFVSPDCYIKKETEFIIRDVTYNKSPNSLTSSISLVFPEVYSGEVRISYPWD
jgi:prophage tail gpP-like protein